VRPHAGADTRLVLDALVASGRQELLGDARDVAKGIEKRRASVSRLAR